jgi:hypothetical protein
MNREEYARRWSSGARDFNRVVDCDVPQDVERVTEHEPCFYCGVRAGLPCRHRRWAA